MVRVYVVANFVHGNTTPYVERIYKATPYIDGMYEAIKSNGLFLSKRNLERLWIMPPVGADFRLLPYELRDDFFEAKCEPFQPDIVDRVHENYMNEQRQKRQNELIVAPVSALVPSKKD